MASPSDEASGEDTLRGGGRVTIDRPTYDELQFEEKIRPLGYKRLKVLYSISRDGHVNKHHLG